MRRSLPGVLCFILLSMAVGTKPLLARGDPVVEAQSSDPALNRAYKQAQQTLSRLTRVFRQPGYSEFMVKVAFRHSGGREHIWMSVDQITNGRFVGVIQNNPVYVTRVERGSSYSARKSELSDWGYVQNGLSYGQFTTRSSPSP